MKLLRKEERKKIAYFTINYFLQLIISLVLDINKLELITNYLF